jgi:cytochrome c oxidase subunit III
MPGTAVDELELQIGSGDDDGGPAINGNGGGDWGGGENPAYRRASMTGITLALGAIMMFFMALTSSYIVRRGASGDWKMFPLPPVLYVNTAILVLSSCTIELARRELQRGREAAFRNMWMLTSGLGLVFVGGQLLAWRDLRLEGVFLSSNPSSSFFYVLTALHGLHLLGGIFALLYVAVRSWQSARVSQETAAQVASIYWHFMDGLWVFLLLLLTLGR